MLGVLPGVIGCIQATETLKLIVGAGTSLIGRLLLFNALEMKFREIKLRRDPRCPVCGKEPTITKLMNEHQACGTTAEPAGQALNPDEVTVQEMKRALDNPALGIRVIDVREPDEYRLARVPGVLQIPLSALPQRFTELDSNQPIYLHCKAGGRSMRALEFLRGHGFKHVKSVRGGILAWSEQIDPRVPKY